MDIKIQIEAVEQADELASILKWLISEDELRGRVRVVDVAPEPGKLGAIADTLIVALGTGGTITVSARTVASVLIAWLQRRTGDVRVKLTAPDGSALEYSATNVRRWKPPELDAAVLALADRLNKSVDGD